MCLPDQYKLKLSSSVLWRLSFTVVVQCGKEKKHLQGTKQPLQDLNHIILQDYLHKATQIPAAYIANCY